MDAPAPVLLSLREGLAEGFLLVTLLQEGFHPTDPQAFLQALDTWIDRWKEDALRQGHETLSVEDACYAFCALVDETLLSRTDALRDLWEQAPLQVRHFNEHLAGEGFFHRLEDRARAPHRHLQALSVFQACLHVGFQGRYRLEPPDGLADLKHRLDQDLRQRIPEPDLPDVPLPSAREQESVPPPIWRPLAAMGLAALALFLVLRLALMHQIDTRFRDAQQELLHE